MRGKGWCGVVAGWAGVRLSAREPAGRPKPERTWGPTHAEAVDSHPQDTGHAVTACLVTPKPATRGARSAAEQVAAEAGPGWQAGGAEDDQIILPSASTS